MQEIMTEAAYGPCYCLYPRALDLGCDMAIESHAIQKSSLHLISDKRNKVYTQHTSLSSPNDIVSIKKVGINKASTFRGFCAKHDNELFQPIEDHPLQICEEHAFLLHFRAERKQLYYYNRLMACYYNDVSPDDGNSLWYFYALRTAFHFQTGNRTWVIGSKAGANLDDVITSGDYSSTRFVGLIIDRVPEIMTCACVTPVVDVTGNTLQDITNPQYLHSISISVLPYGTENGVILFSWVGESKVCERFIRSILTLPTQAICATIVRMLFHRVKDIYFSPHWWNKLPPDAKASLSERFLHIFRGRPDCYVDSEDDGYNYINWNVVGFETNL